MKENTILSAYLRINANKCLIRIYIHLMRIRFKSFSYNKSVCIAINRVYSSDISKEFIKIIILIKIANFKLLIRSYTFVTADITVDTVMLMSKMACVCKEHSHIMLVCRINDFFIPYAASGLNHTGSPGICRCFHTVSKRKKSIGGDGRIFK